MEKDQWQEKGAGHRQRLRDKFLAQGIEAFTDSEVLELILALGTPRKDTKEPARALLKEYGTLAHVLELSQPELSKIHGVGDKNSFAIHFIHAVARRYLRQRLKDKQYISSSRDVAEYLVHAMRDLKKEVFWVMFLDTSHAIIDSEFLAEGTINSNTIYPREIIKKALAYNATAVVLGHNHPSGKLEPSSEDRRLTKKLYIALSYVTVTVLDHFIVGGSQQPYSFADHGLMEQIKQECAALG
nr:DNA repair protein RadC [Desulfobulbaceae bacterium]